MSDHDTKVFLGNDRRKDARIKIGVPIEIRAESVSSPIRGATADISLSGCYFETVYPFPVGTSLDLQLSVDATIILVAATVATCDPQVGNGISFSRMLSEDREALKVFLEAAQQAEEDKSSGAAAS